MDWTKADRPILRNPSVRRRIVAVLLIVVGLATTGPARGQARGVRVQLAGAAGTPVEVAYGRQWALIVGINRYDAWPRLENAVLDARTVRDLLVNRFEYTPADIHELYDGQATYAAVMEQLQFFSRQLGEDDNLFIYFSGHGYVDQFDTGYLVPVNAPENPEANPVLITNQVLTGFLTKCRARHIFVVSDACFAGSLFQQLKSGARVPPAELVQLKSRQGLTSSRMHTASDGQAGRHSPFARLFIEYLQLDKPFISATEVSAFLENQLPAQTGDGQVPIGRHFQNVGDSGGELYFFPRAAAVPSPDPSSPPPPPPPLAIAAMGHLQVNVNAAGAKVYLDGQYRGTASPGQPLNEQGLPAGPVRVRAEAEGFEPAEQQVTVEAGRWNQLMLELSPKAAPPPPAPPVSPARLASPADQVQHGHYIDNGDGTITDTNTGLMWTKTDSLKETEQGMNWNEAKTWVDGLTTGGHTDWRLPTIAELKTIYDPSYQVLIFDRDSKYPPGTCPLFSAGGALWFWSSEDAGSGSSLGMQFGVGNVGVNHRLNSSNDTGARGVRSAGR